MIEQWGSHAFYILLAYGAGSVVFLFLVLEPWWRRRRLFEQLRTQQRRSQLSSQSEVE